MKNQTESKKLNSQTPWTKDRGSTVSSFSRLDAFAMPPYFHCSPPHILEVSFSFTLWKVVDEDGKESLPMGSNQGYRTVFFLTL